MEPLEVGDNDGKHVWVKMPRATKEEQLAAGQQSRSTIGAESEKSVTCSRRDAGGESMKVYGDVDIGTVDVERVQFHCSLKSLCLEVWSMK